MRGSAGEEARNIVANWPHQPPAPGKCARCIRSGGPEVVKGHEVLVVDDVYTTGATVSECARVLRRAGATKVWVATVARTLKNSEQHVQVRFSGHMESGEEPVVQEIPLARAAGL